jgi:hypothetical protein
MSGRRLSANLSPFLYLFLDQEPEHPEQTPDQRHEDSEAWDKFGISTSTHSSISLSLLEEMGRRRSKRTEARSRVILLHVRVKSM